MGDSAEDWVGSAIPRLEDAALLSGNARFIDDLSPLPGIRHVALLRSPYPHARIREIDTRDALALPGVIGILTGSDIAEMTDPLVSAVRAPVAYYPIAVKKVRYAGEPVALVAAEDRYIAEDAAEKSIEKDTGGRGFRGVDAVSWREICDLAARCLVSGSDKSRLNDAGAGFIDED